MGKFLASFLHYTWGILLIVGSNVIINDLFDPNLLYFPFTQDPNPFSQYGYGILWQIATIIAPLAVCLIKALATNYFRGMVGIAGLTYSFAILWSLVLDYAALTGNLAYFSGTTDALLTTPITSIFTLPIEAWMLVFLGSEKLQNLVLLWLREKDWYNDIMDNRITRSANGLHGRNTLMSVQKARAEFNKKDGVLLGVPHEPKNLVSAWAEFFWRKTILGEPLNAKKNMDGVPVDPIHYSPNEGMTLMIGPTRTGKFTSFCGPNLLGNMSPFIVLDPKGENYAMTAYKRMKDGRKCIAIDPLGILNTGFYIEENKASKTIRDEIGKTRWRCNPFDFVGDNPKIYETDIMAIINPLFPSKKGGGDDDFWNEDGKAKMAGIASWIIDSDTWFDGEPFPDHRRNLFTIVELLSLNPIELKMFADYMASGKGQSVRGFKEVGLGGPKLIGGQILTVLQSEKQWSGLVSTILTKLRWIDESMRQCIARSGCSYGKTLGSGLDTEFIEDESEFQPYNYSELWNGETDIFLVIPPTRLQDLGPWLRMMIMAIVNVIKNNIHQSIGKQFIFLLDELAQIGGIDELKGLSAFAAGVGIHLVMIFQTLAQIKEQYGTDGYNTLMGNSYLKLFLGASDIDTAEYLVKYIGKTTAIATTQSYGGQQGSLSSNVNIQTQTAGVDLISNQEILGTPKDRGYAVFSRQKSVLPYTKVQYYQDPSNRDENGIPLYPVPNPFDIAQINKYKEENNIV